MSLTNFSLNAGVGRNAALDAGLRRDTVLMMDTSLGCCAHLRLHALLGRWQKEPRIWLLRLKMPLQVWKRELVEARVHYQKRGSGLSYVQSQSWLVIGVISVLCICTDVQCYDCISKMENSQVSVSVVHPLETIFP